MSSICDQKLFFNQNMAMGSSNGNLERKFDVSLEGYKNRQIE